MNDDGRMARLPELKALAQTHDLPMCSVADVIEKRLQRDQLIERIAETELANDIGVFRLIAYRSRVDPMPHVALVCGDVGRQCPDGLPIDHDEPVLVRMHSQNLLGDVFGDLSQPSGQTLRQAMRMLHEHGSGAVVYLRHEGMGRGLVRRLQSAEEGEDAGVERPMFDPGEHDDSSSQEHQQDGANLDAPTARRSDYGIGSQVLRDLGVRRLRLITAHPFTPGALSGFGLSIDSFVDPETGQETPAESVSASDLVGR